MEFPIFLYGLNKDVHKAVKKYVKKIQKDLGNFNIPDSEMFEIDSNKHCIGLGKRTWYRENIYLFWLFDEIIIQTRNKNFVYECFYETLKYSWATLCLFGGVTSYTQLVFAESKESLLPFIKAVNNYWDQYLRLGNIFMDLTEDKKNVWEVLSNLKKALALLGVPNDRLNDKTIPKDLLDLVEMYKRP